MRALRIMTVPVLLSLAVTLIAAGPAQAATARSGNLKILFIREDGFRNYDFTNRTVTSTGVDWTVALLFWNNATINRVKNSGIGPLYDQTGGTMHGRLRESTATGYVWDDDGGRKTTKCPGAPFQPRNARHYRVYADGDDRLYNLDWGYWVYGTTHWDMDECSLWNPAWFGYSENAEGWLVSDWVNRTGWGATNDWASFYNSEPFRVQGDHIWDSNGLASAFRVG
jgi:hypothetical protein